MEISIRDELYTTSVAPTYRNMVNDYEEIKFKNNKLYILGYSYNYEGTYKKKEDITRVLILENQKDYKQEYIDLGSKKGPYEITTLDKKDKTYAWYEKEIDISNLEKGTYTLQVYTKTKDAEDYSEITDIFGNLKTQETTSNDKTYQITLNRDRQNRIELIVK